MKVFKKGRRTHSSSVVKSAATALETVSKKEREQIASEDAVRSIKKQISNARARGLTWQEIAAAIQEAGLTIAVSTLKKVAGKTEKHIQKKTEQKKPLQASIPAPAPAAARVRQDVQKKAPAPAAPAAVSGGFKVDLTSAADI